MAFPTEIPRDEIPWKSCVTWPCTASPVTPWDAGISWDLLAHLEPGMRKFHDVPRFFDELRSWVQEKNRIRGTRLYKTINHQLFLPMHPTFSPNWHQLHPAKSYIISHDGSMVQVYMLTWLGYMDGIHGTPYIAAPVGSVMGIFPSSHPRRGCEPALGAYQFARDFFCTVAEVTGGQAVALSSAAMLADVTGWWEKMLRKMRVSHILYESHIITDIHWL